MRSLRVLINKLFICHAFKKTFFLNRFISYTQQLKFTESGYNDREKIITSMQSFKATLVYLFMYRLQINI